MKKQRTVVLVLAVGIVIGLAFSGLLGGPADIAAAPKTDQARESLAELQDFANNLETLFRSAAESVSPAVVFISTEKTIRVTTPGLPRDPMLERFFGPHSYGPREREYKQSGLGSGIILDGEGYILTNNHVVAEADELKVKLLDGRTFDAKPVGADPATDLAVIKLEGEPGELPVAPLGDSDELDVGEWVVAIGNPFGFSHTVSAGIVSAKGRVLGMSDYEDLIQTDAAINPGNSGGPLVNLNGQVVGINNTIFSRTGGYQGIGFAIPINMAKGILDELKAGKKVERGFLGIYGQDLNPEIATQFGYEGEGGTLVNEVAPDAPAAKAGLEAGDIITHWRGALVKDWAHLRQMVADTEPGEKAQATIWRDGKQKTITLEVALRQDYEQVGWLGITVAPLTEEVKNQLGRNGLQGVVVAEVAEDSPARGGIEGGDVILSVARRPVRSVAEYQKAVADANPRRGVVLHVLHHRTGRARFILVRK